jgi:DNA repair exonuclease SbcCD ATPase subunit
MQGSAKHNLHLFKKLIGEDCFRRVVLATTMWENVNPLDGIRRENELKNTEDFWGFMHKKGSQVMRHEKNNRGSAMKVLDHFLTREKEEVVLAIQDEMVNLGLNLDETEAGRQITEEITLLQDKHRKELKHLEIEIQEAKDQESITSIQNLQQEYEQKIEEARKDRESIRASMARLQEEQRIQLQEMERRHALEAEDWKRDKAEFENLRSQADSDDREHMDELIKRERDLERKKKELEARYNRNERRRIGGKTRISKWDFFDSGAKCHRAQFSNA